MARTDLELLTQCADFTLHHTSTEWRKARINK